MGKKGFEYEIRGYRYAPESFRAFRGLPGQKMEQIPLSGEQRRKMGYLCMTQGGKAGVAYVKHIERERERKCRLYMTYGFLIKENPHRYVYCAELRCRESDPLAVRLDNAEAAIANIESWHINPSFASLPGVVNYTNIEAVDEYTIRLTYDTPYFAYINDFCWPDVCTMISPKLITQGDFQTVNGYAGTGPYVYDEYVAGQYTTFVRNENYWGEQPYYDKIVAKYIPDNASRVQALQTGEIDLIYGSAELSYEDYNQATAIEGIEGKFAPSGSTIRNIILNFNGNLADLSVRQALAYAIDKGAISEGLTYGYEPVADTIVPDGTPYSDICGTIDYTYNVDRANQLLDEAGWAMNESTGIREKDGTPLHIVFTCPTDDSTIGSIATLIQSQLAEVGIEVEIKSMEKMEWYASYMEPTGWDITAMTAGFFNYAMPQCWFSAMMAQMPEDVSIPLLDNSDEFISALSEFKTCNDDTRLRELFELLINTDLDQVLDVPLTHQMDMIVYNTDKIADYNFASDYAFLDVTQITPAE